MRVPNSSENVGEKSGTRVTRPSESIPRLVFQSNSPFVRLYHGNCLELLDANVIEHMNQPTLTRAALSMRERAKSYFLIINRKRTRISN
jgi:hypothetical protein